jgi:hypothetical protein
VKLRLSLLREHRRFRVHENKIQRRIFENIKGTSETIGRLHNEQLHALNSSYNIGQVQGDEIGFTCRKPEGVGNIHNILAGILKIKERIL